MPFTFAHPAIVLPIKKYGVRLSLSGLVAGSVAPDFEFIFRMKAVQNIGHHWQGIFWLDLPLAILLCFGFHRFIRDLLIDRLPYWYKVRMVSLTSFNWNQYFIKNVWLVVLSILIGIVTHLAWDSITHYDGLLVLLLPVFRYELPLPGFPLPVYSVLQVVSSVVGLWVIQNRIAHLQVTDTERSEHARLLTFWISVAGLSFFILLLRLLWQPAYRSVWDVFFAAMGSVAYSLFVHAWFYRKAQKIRLEL